MLKPFLRNGMWKDAMRKKITPKIDDVDLSGVERLIGCKCRSRAVEAIAEAMGLQVQPDARREVAVVIGDREAPVEELVAGSFGGARRLIGEKLGIEPTQVWVALPGHYGPSQRRAIKTAAHRAGFFAARTWRFNFRTALCQFIAQAGDGLSLSELPKAFIEHWSARMGENAFITTFIAPNMGWFADFDVLKKTGKLPAESKLRVDVERRIGWEITSEFGFSARIGRTLEKTLSATAHCPEPTILQKIETDPFLAILKDYPMENAALFQRVAAMLGNRLVSLYPSIA